MAWSRSTLAKSTCSKFKFTSFSELFEFPVVSWSSWSLCTVLRWRTIFLFAPKLFLHLVQGTLMWFFLWAASNWLLINEFVSTLPLQCCAFSCDSVGSIFRRNSHHISHMLAMSCHDFYFDECTGTLPLQKLCHTHCRGRYPSFGNDFDQLINWYKVESKWFLKLSLSRDQIDGLSAKFPWFLTDHVKASYKSEIMMSHWAQKEPLSQKRATEGKMSHWGASW